MKDGLCIGRHEGGEPAEAQSLFPVRHQIVPSSFASCY
jgi:hypothetical protein